MIYVNKNLIIINKEMLFTYILHNNGNINKYNLSINFEINWWVTKEKDCKFSLKNIFSSVFLSNVFLLGIAATWLYTSAFLRSKKKEINGDQDFNEWLAWTISASVFFVIGAISGVLQMFITNRYLKFSYIGFLTVGFVLYCIGMLLAYDSRYFNV